MSYQELYELARAETIQEGDRVHFEVPRHSYCVETVETRALGLVCFRFNEDTGSQCFAPSDLLYVERAQ